MKLSVALTIGLVALASPRALDAQGREKKQEIPASSRPPAGMCRIWLEGVPAAQQPAPTDCTSGHQRLRAGEVSRQEAADPVPVGASSLHDAGS